MDKVALKSTVTGIFFVLLSAVLLVTGFLTAMEKSVVLGIIIALGGTIAWGYSCFGGKIFHDEEKTESS